METEHKTDDHERSSRRSLWHTDIKVFTFAWQPASPSQSVHNTLYTSDLTTTKTRLFDHKYHRCITFQPTLTV